MSLWAWLGPGITRCRAMDYGEPEQTVAQTSPSVIIAPGRRMEPLARRNHGDFQVRQSRGTAGRGSGRRLCSKYTCGPNASPEGWPLEVGWGPAAEGLQCRLRPTRAVVAAGENPAFRIDLCNRGGRVFAFLCGEQAPVHQVSIDGRWRRWPDRPPTDGKIRALGPGVEVPDLPVILRGDARSFLSPGRHIVQFAFSFEGVEVVSNPVEIEILGSR